METVSNLVVRTPWGAGLLTCFQSTKPEQSQGHKDRIRQDHLISLRLIKEYFEIACMVDASDEELKAWLSHMRELSKSASAHDEGAAQRRAELFAKLPTPENQMGNDEKSRMLDSPEMESKHAVNHLMKKPDGTTVVHYYFPSEVGEVNSLCGNDSQIHLECEPYKDGNDRKVARAALRDIAIESKAKIEFQEVFSLEQAGISFVKSAKPIEAEKLNHIEGYAGRSGDKNYVVDLDTAIYSQIIKRELSSASSEQREILRRSLQEKYGDNADIFRILLSQATEVVLAHEVQHMLGAKHPNAVGGIMVTKDGNPDDFNQSIMGSSQGLPIGQVLKELDIQWYQRHFGVKDLPQGTLPAPSIVQTDRLGGNHER